MANLGKIDQGMIILVILFGTSLWGGVEAQLNCASAIRSLSPCMSFSFGNTSNPSTSCCSQLASMAETLPTCICDVNFVGAQVLGLVLNRTLIQALPRACNVEAPALTDCNGLGSQNNTDGGSISYFDSEGFKLKTSMLLAIFLALGSYLISFATLSGYII
uniref:Bifunctional inhibitor/plant lipid transfer protein/seed storage helical domain-containing protein n=1 Tax=Opuntia streptacantha TaxID=393608 RepID=A0A7C9DWY7_OPUST